MRTYGTKSLVLPAVLATAAAAMTLVYAGHGGPKDAAAAAGTTGVYVATRDIAAGASGDDVRRALRLVRLSPDAVVPSAVTNATQLAGRVLLSPVYAGQQITLRAFGGIREQGVAGQLSGALRAIAVDGDENQVLAGTLRDGDHVDVVASLKAPDGRHVYGRTVLRNVVVLHAPDAPSSTPGASTTSSATLRVTDAQAQTLFFVTKNGDWSFVLRPAVHSKDSGDFVDSVGTIIGAGR